MRGKGVPLFQPARAANTLQGPSSTPRILRNVRGSRPCVRGSRLASAGCMSELHDPLTERIIACAIEVHRMTGPGLLESVYDVCLAYELELAGLDFQRQKNISFAYKGLSAQAAFRVDLVVESTVLVELKCVESIQPVHKAQVLTYLRLSGLPTGLLINFNVPVLRDGIRRLIWTHNPKAALTSAPLGLP